MTRKHLLGVLKRDQNFSATDLTSCRVHGISGWKLKLEGGRSRRARSFMPKQEPEITVEYLEVAQFIYLLLNNEESDTS